MKVEESYFQIVIKTDSYAGNFEREMTAYCTGIVGDCGVGSKKAELFELEVAKEFDIMQREEEGVYRPCTILYQDPNSLAIFFHGEPTLEEFSIVGHRCESFSGSIRILDVYVEQVTIYKEVKRLQLGNNSATSAG